MPFFRLDDDGPAEVVLAQVGDGRFRLVEGFRYAGPAGEVRVEPRDLPSTDLASIPWFVRWFASAHGRHTPAALLHDHLVRNGAHLSPPVTRVDADRRFLEALAGLDVPAVRRYVMWGAVTFATRWRSGGWARSGVAVWAAAALAGTALLAFGAVSGNVVLAAAAALGPVPFALLWGSQVVAGLVAGYGVAIVGLPSVGVFAGYGVYWLTEQVANVMRKAVPRNRGRPLPGPTPVERL